MLASYLFVPLLIVIGLALFIHCTLVLVRSRTEAIDHDIIGAERSEAEEAVQQRTLTLIRRNSQIIPVEDQISE